MVRIIVLFFLLLVGCSYFESTEDPKDPSGGSPTADTPYPPSGPVEVAITYEGVFDCSGHLCQNQAFFDLGPNVVENENNLVSITLPQVITNGCSFVDGESCSTNMFDVPVSALIFEGEIGTCIYDLHGSPTRYVAREVACTIEVDKTTSVIKTNAPNESSLRITLKYLVWE